MNEPVLENVQGEDFIVDESHSFSLRNFDRKERRDPSVQHQVDNLLCEPSRFSNVSGFDVPRNEDLSTHARERCNEHAI